MNKEYCIKCGGKAEFTVSKPKFCPSCGSPFNRSEKTLSKATVEFEDFEDDEESEEEPYIDIESLRRKNIFKAEVESVAKLTIGDLTPGSQNTSHMHRSPRAGEEELSGKDLIKKIESECRMVKSSKELG